MRINESFKQMERVESCCHVGMRRQLYLSCKIVQQQYNETQIHCGKRNKSSYDLCVIQGSSVQHYIASVELSDSGIRSQT